MKKELRHDRHTVSLPTDHMVFSPKYRAKILVGDVGLLTEAIIRKTCLELDITIVDMSVNSDHVHLFIQYSPKYSVSYIAKMIKGRTSRILRQEFPEPKRMVSEKSLGSKLLSWKCWSWMGSCGKVYCRTGSKIKKLRLITGLVT